MWEVILDGNAVYHAERGEARDGQVMVRVCCGECTRYVVCHYVGAGGETVERICYCPEVWAEVEDQKVVGSVMLESADRRCV